MASSQSSGFPVFARRNALSTLDGFPVPDEGIVIYPVPPTTVSIVLATDGYPVLKRTLEDSESALRDVLAQDPLMCRLYKSTKGILQGNVSFDDRAYVKFSIHTSSATDSEM